MYAPLPKSDGQWKRYKLQERGKAFESLFFASKPRLLALLDQFSRRDGKFAIPGYPHKLGLLLHGPPGTGKTSLIKALAAHTGRNVVNIALGRVATNQELMDLCFDLKFAVRGEDVPIKLDFTKLIFVLEDVDAATTAVHARAKGDKDGGGAGGGARDDDDGSDDAWERPDPLLAIMLAMSKMDAASNKKSKDAGAGGGAATPFDLTGIAGPEPNNDKLDLSGILNVRLGDGA